MFYTLTTCTERKCIPVYWDNMYVITHMSYVTWLWLLSGVFVCSHFINISILMFVSTVELWTHFTVQIMLRYVKCYIRASCDISYICLRFGKSKMPWQNIIIKHMISYVYKRKCNRALRQQFRMGLLLAGFATITCRNNWIIIQKKVAERW